jgi:heat shock protein HslJ
MAIRINRRRKCPLILLGGILAIFSVPTLILASSNGARPEDLEGREWQIANYFIGKEQTWPFRKIGQKDDAYVSFENGTVQGSPGCGRFTGTYHQSGRQLTISAQWTNHAETRCDTNERKNAEHILKSLTSVRSILEPPEYWHSDALLLADANGSTQITISPMQRGKDLSEFQDTFWRLTKLEGSVAEFSDVIIEIGKRDITLSTASYSASYPFRYNLSGLELFPAWHTASSNNDQWGDKPVAQLFPEALSKTSSYVFNQETLTFFNKVRQPVVVLKPLQLKGIENRRWRIAKYRGDGSKHADDEDLVDATESADITFMHGRVQGSPGCGGWIGTYRLSGDHLTVEAQWALAGLCYQAGLDQDRLVENAFKRDLRIEENGNHILLRDMTGKARILLVPY